MQMLALAAALALSSSGIAIVDRAVRRAGGQARLSRVLALRWEGRARIFAKDRVIDIGLSTRVVPLVSARSDSWPIAQGKGAMRSLIIDPRGGWVERGGKREPLPTALTAHEREQYEIYATLLLEPVLGHGGFKPAADRTDCADASFDGSPVTRLCFDERGSIVEASNRVASPEGSGTVAQRFSFSGELRDKGVRWFRTMTIEQDGKPYFELSIDRFSVERAPR